MPVFNRRYNRFRALEYAERWAFERNPLFASYGGIGGDCTNFVSQCVFAGCCVMNFTPTFGWYYLSDGDRAPAWTGVEYFYNFITSNKEEGPYGIEVTENEVTVGDVVQLGDADGDFYHSLIISGMNRRDGILVAAHSNDAFDRLLDSYDYASIRFIKILGVRTESILASPCFDRLISGESLSEER